MDISRFTTDLDLLVEKLNALRVQVETAIATTKPKPETALELARLRALEVQVGRARAGAIAARSAARLIAPKSYQTETSGI
jgi:hypothetical protein